MSPKKILIIDDDPGVIRLNQALLSSLNYAVVSATNGLDGVRLSEEEAPDAIILDVILPKMHGFEVCRKIKQNEKTKSIPVIMVTATGLEDIAANEKDVMADAYLAKPYGIERLKEVLHQVLS
jgi:CheY-like chemotaxis protein